MQPELSERAFCISDACVTSLTVMLFSRGNKNNSGVRAASLHACYAAPGTSCSGAADSDMRLLQLP